LKIPAAKLQQLSHKTQKGVLMSEQEMRNKMDFIVEQQAQFAIDMHQLREQQTIAETRTSRLEGAMVMVVNMIGDLTKTQNSTAEAQKITDETVRKMAENVTALTEKMDILVDLAVKRTLGEQNRDENESN
jgi:TolA-binding protein